MLENLDRPCRGFVGRGKRVQFQHDLAPGMLREVRVERAGVIPVTCDRRTHARGTSVVVGASWFALTDCEGAFAIEASPPGADSMHLCEEGLGRVNDATASQLQVDPGATLRANVQVSVPPPDA